MLGWSISASACRSASKRAITSRRVHAGLDDFQGHLAADGLLLLGHEDEAHAAFADLLQQLVGADDRAGPLGEAAPVDGLEQYLGRAIEERPVLFVGREQPIDHFPQARVAGASPVQVRPPLDRIVDLHGVEEDGSLVHGHPPRPGRRRVWPSRSKRTKNNAKIVRPGTRRLDDGQGR